MATEQQQARKPIDTEAMRALIAKVKKVTGDNAEAIATEITDRTDKDAEIITSLEYETTARRRGDELLQQQIEEVAVQTNWDEDDSSSPAYLQNRPAPITKAEIDALFI